MDTTSASATGPTVVDRAAQAYIGISGTVTMDDFTPVADRMPELFAHLEAEGVPPAGAPFIRYHCIDMERELLVEAGVPVAGPVPVTGDISAGELPAGRYAWSLYVGHPDGMVAASAELQDWAAREGLQFDCRPSPHGELWGCRTEMYHSDPRDAGIGAMRIELAYRLVDEPGPSAG